MSISDISPIGLPQSLKYDQLPSISDSVTNYQVSVSPSGLTQIGPVPVIAADAPFVQNKPGFLTSAFSNQTIDFQIPSGNNDNIFMDTRETFLTFRMVVNCTTAAVGATAGLINLISSASSFIDNLTLFSNNVPVEQIYNYNILYNQLLNASVNLAERYGPFSISQGCDVDTHTGVNIGFAAGVMYYTFTVPLISIIGLNTAGSSGKLFPVGSIGNLLLRLQTTSLLPFASSCTAITTQPVYQITLDSFNLTMSYVNIGEISGALLKQSLYDGKYFIKSCTYTGANSSIANGTSGNVSIPLQIRNSSVKSLFWQFSVAKGDRSPNGYFDAFNINSTSTQANLAGVKYPNKPMSPSLRPSETYTNYLCSWGGHGMKNIGGLMYRGSYGATLNAVTGSDSSIVVPTAAGLRARSQVEATTDQIASYPNMHFEGLNLERISGALFSGVNSRQSPPFLEINIATPIDLAVTCYAFALSDCILKVDPATKTLEVLL